jgi:hypothetical protein
MYVGRLIDWEKEKTMCEYVCMYMSKRIKVCMCVCMYAGRLIDWEKEKTMCVCMCVCMYV